MERNALHRTIWRWHFYAGLIVMPLVLLLSVTGATFLFKPQIERWEERAYQGLPTAGSVSPDAQRDAALAAFPGATFHAFRLPERGGDAAMVHLALPGGAAIRDVFVSPQGKVLGAFDPDSRMIALDQKLHGQLLLGRGGSWVVEFAASWAIVMILSGLYLWWPQGSGLAGVVYPRLWRGSRVFWRDLHAVMGFWVSGLALILLITGLPWADVWGSTFKAVRGQMGWVAGAQDWTIGGRPAEAGEHAGHDHAAMVAGESPASMNGMAHVMPDGTRMVMPSVSLGTIVARANSEHLPFPVLVTPPSARQQPGTALVSAWTVKSEAQNRPQRVTITYDAMTGKEIARETFAEKHPIDRIVGYGVSWHEGQLFGAINQLIGLATALMLIALTVSGFVMWWRRKPEGRLGAPPLPQDPARNRGLVAIILILAALLPLLAASLMVLWAAERLFLPRLPRLTAWLGVPVAA